MDERTLQELKNSPTEISAERKLSQGELSCITDIHSAPQNLFSILLEMRKTSSSTSKQDSKNVTSHLDTVLLLMSLPRLLEEVPKTSITLSCHQSLSVPPGLCFGYARGEIDQTRRAVSLENSCKRKLDIWNYFRNTENRCGIILLTKGCTVFWAYSWSEEASLWNDSSFYLPEL